VGLDWEPGNKAASGHEEEFRRLWALLAKGGDTPELQAAAARFTSISIPSYVTLGAPRVGIDEVATNWARENYARTESEVSEEEWLETHRGFYVLPLAEPCDGLPIYTNGWPGGYVDVDSFRAQFLVNQCSDIMGESLLKRAYDQMLPEEMVEYGRALLAKARSVAGRDGLDFDNLNHDDSETHEASVHIMREAGRWCVWWGERGHTLYAYY
jgi:hypothetical protein